jgi:hypothetical protein
MPCLVQCFKGHAPGYRPITDNCHHVVVIATKVTGNSHTEGG